MSDKAVYADGETACSLCGGFVLLGERIERSDGNLLGPCCASFSPGVCKKCQLVHNGECF